MRRVPRPLLAVLATAALLALAWACVLPPFQGPDENRHFAYAQRIVERGEIPWTALTDVEREPFRASTEQRAAEAWSATDTLKGNPAARPYRERIDEQRWHRVRAGLSDADRADGGSTPAMRNPPLYYLYASAVYAPLGGADVLTRAFAVRVASIPLLLLAVVAAWLLAGEVFGRRRWLQTIVAGTVAVQPVLGEISGTISPDAAIAAAWAWTLYACAVVLRRGLTWRRAAGLVALVVVAALIHARDLALLAPVAATLGLGLWRLRPGGRLLAAGAWAAGVAVFCAAIVVRAVDGDVTAGRVREFGSYLWQFYLPRPGFLEPVKLADWDVRDVFVDRFFSGFAHFDVTLAPGLLDVLAVAEVALALALVAALVARRDAVRAHAPVAIVLGVAVVAGMLVLHAEGWNSLLTTDDPVVTGRYLTVFLPVVGLGLATICSALPRRVGPAAGLAVLGAGALLSLDALATALVRFHV